MNLNAQIVISALDRSGMTFQQIGRNAKTLESQLQSSVRQVNSFARSFTMAVGVPFAAFTTNMLRSAGQFEQGLNVLRATTGATVADMQRIKEQALAIGESTVFSSREVLDAQTALVKNGLKVKQVLDGAAASAVNLAAATGAQLATAADITTDAMQNFRIEAERTDKVANQVAGTLIASKFDIDDFRLAMAQAGGMAGSLGVTFEDFNAVIAGTSTAFGSGSDAGTSFKTFLTRLTPQSKEAREAMRQLGLEFFNANGSMKSMSEIADELQDGLGNLVDESKARALQLIFGQDAQRTAIKLMDLGAAGVRRYREEIAQANAADQARARMGGWTGAVEELSGAWETLLNRIGDAGVLRDATGLVRSLGDGIKTLSSTSPDLLRFGFNAGLAVVGVGALTWGLTGLVALTAKILAASAAIAALATAVTGLSVAAPLPLLLALLAGGGLYAANRLANDVGAENRKGAYRDYSEGFSASENAARNYQQWHGVPFEGGMHRAGRGAGPMPGVRRRAAGGPVPPGSWTVVGERGPEIVSFGQAGMVHDASATGDMFAGGGMAFSALKRILEGLEGVMTRLERLFGRPGMPGGLGGGVLGLGGSLGGVGGIGGPGGPGGVGAVRDAIRNGNIVVPDGKGGVAAVPGAIKPFGMGGGSNPFLDLIGRAEGTDRGRGYNETLGYGAFTGGPRDLTSMTLDEIDAMQGEMLAHPANRFNSSAAGRYQIVRKTLRSLRRQLGLSGGEKFDRKMQDRLAMSPAEGRGANPAALRNEWEGLRGVSDSEILSAYGRRNDASSQAILASQLRYVNQAAVRNQKLTESLEGRIREAVGAVYGPGARADIYSGGQNATGLARIGSTRHDKGMAGDAYIYDAKGNRITGDGLAPLAQYWQAKGWGGTGLEMRGGGIHLDEHANRARFWTYSQFTQAQVDAVRKGQAGIYPTLFKGPGGSARPGEADGLASEFTRLRRAGAGMTADDMFSPGFRRGGQRVELGKGSIDMTLKLDKGLSVGPTRVSQPDQVGVNVGVDRTGELGWQVPRVRQRV